MHKLLILRFNKVTKVIKPEINSLASAVLIALTLAACGSDSDSPDYSRSTGDADVVMINRIDDTTGFLVAADGLNSIEVTNGNGVELDPSSGIMTYNGIVYTTGSLTEDKVKKFVFDGQTFVKEGEFITGEGARAGSIIFVNETKAYVNTLFTPELIVFNPGDMTITNRIDLSPYALGENDTNPNATTGVIRDGKLYLGLAQIDTLETFKCQAGASLLIIDVATDTVEKHIQDDRACFTGALQPNSGLIMDELGDIYVNNDGAYGFYPGLKAGFLRIKNGADEFDPDYFFSITDLELPGVPGGAASYAYHTAYAGDGFAYANLSIPGLSSNPPDYVNDKSFLAYRIDLRNQTVTALDIPPTAGWAGDTVIYDDRVIFGRSTDFGTGLFFYDPASGTDIGDQIPSITTQGSPVFLGTF